ncbi:MAG: hypothetical protein KDB14_20825 [Planctomycetales bacterium]|nr:hypothetical protein [Planctomycetales bacterium]
MPGSARSKNMDPTQIETHHVWSRCVQGMWLLGKDRYTGIDHSHRRHWFDALVEYLASVFAVDVGGPSLLANHS